jgi:hypothetical protein
MLFCSTEECGALLRIGSLTELRCNRERGHKGDHCRVGDGTTDDGDVMLYNVMWFPEKEEIVIEDHDITFDCKELDRKTWACPHFVGKRGPSEGCLRFRCPHLIATING